MSGEEMTGIQNPEMTAHTENGNGLRFLAVFRGTQHAAKHVTNDSAMFELVCAGLEAEGFTVDRVQEGELSVYLESNPAPERIISMAQRPEHIEQLERLEEAGAYVANSTAAVKACFRTELVERLRGTSVPFARSLSVPTGSIDFEEIEQIVGLPFWIKRGDIHAAHENDVVMVGSEKECREAVRDFRLRDIPDLIVQPHFDGPVVKFYGVRNTGFFHTLDFNTGEPMEPTGPELHDAAEAAAERLGLTMYGGDAVLTGDDRFVLIDFNAWPSFGNVRDEAAPYMVGAILRDMPGRPE